MPFNQHINDERSVHSQPTKASYNQDPKMEKSKSFPQSSSEFGFEDRTDQYTFNGPSWKAQAFGPSSDPEVKRKKRIAGYNMFTTEGKVKASVRESLKWIKTKINGLRYSL
ncbi:UNVERIFIED_CONTAM: hypothetical protein Sradi_3488500 [Sesamum radiatum]|uniref:Uncharacterized protein n=1 Tax=Sesamum radiatum TaxID=300843 RepID=A0AAW2QDQ5_SESRA